MMRRWLARAVFATTALASAGTHAEPMGSSCLYNDKLYSDGALICVQKSLMLGCTADGMHAAWKAVDDPAMQGRCQVPSMSAYTPAASRHRYRVHTAQSRINTSIDNHGKCFEFAGKRYCE